MSERWSYSAKGFAEAAAPYGSADAGPHTKLSISLPADLVEVVRAAAAESGMSVSAMIGASLRRTLEDAEQARLDRALELDAEENLAWATAYLPIAAKLWSEIEW
ncbi:MAG: ribbon-helix-helix protein, CopG family [Candidatus Limnocylindrales bacterium]